MSSPYMGEIRMVAGTFAPAGWAFCDGSILAISEYETLYNLIGTTYGGDGQSTFALPDLRGRGPVHMGPLSGGQTYTLGEMAGVEQVTLNTPQIPAHTHVPQATTNNGNTSSPENARWARVTSNPPYRDQDPSVTMGTAGTAISGSVGGSQPHENMQPYLTISFIISLYGIFPSPN